jgi:hypothetical protein
MWTGKGGGSHSWRLCISVVVGNHAIWLACRLLCLGTACTWAGARQELCCGCMPPRQPRPLKHIGLYCHPITASLGDACMPCVQISPAWTGSVLWGLGLLCNHRAAPRQFKLPFHLLHLHIRWAAAVSLAGHAVRGLAEVGGPGQVPCKSRSNS